MTDAERIEAAVNAALPVPGWMTEQELRHLASRAVTCSTMLEIGSWQGRATKAFAVALPPGSVIYCVDDWRGEQATPVDPHELRGAFYTHLMRELMLGKVIHLTTTSMSFARMMSSGWINSITSFDYIFIDGSHDKASVIADVRAYLPFVAPGGILAGHDWQLPDVRAGVLAMLPGAVCVAGSIWEWRVE